jgi:hypothetical protein
MGVDMARRRLATEIFLIAHDEASGALHVGPDLLGCGLVGAQVAELVIAGRLDVADGQVVPGKARGDDSDEIGSYVVESVLGQGRTHSVGAWVEALRDVLYDLVGGRLVAEGVVRREQGGRQLMRRRPDRFPAIDPSAAAAPRVRLERMLSSPQNFDLTGAVVGVLAEVMGAVFVLNPTIDRSATRELIGRIEENLPVQLAELVAGVRAAVSAVPLAVRR